MKDSLYGSSTRAHTARAQCLQADRTDRALCFDQELAKFRRVSLPQFGCLACQGLHGREQVSLFAEGGALDLLDLLAFNLNCRSGYLRFTHTHTRNIVQVDE